MGKEKIFVWQVRPQLVFIVVNFHYHNTFGNHMGAVLSFDFAHGLRLVKTNN